MKQIFALICLVMLAGCTHEMTVNSDFVASHRGQFVSQKMGSEKACLVIPPEFRNYVFEKKAYNWAGGNTIKDTLYFDIGKALSAEIDNLVSAMYGETCRSADIKDAAGKKAVIIKPEIIDCSLDLPIVRGGKIKAEVQVKYLFFDTDGSPAGSQTVSGIGEKTLAISKENYNIAFQEAIKDFLHKSKEVIEKR